MLTRLLIVTACLPQHTYSFAPHHINTFQTRDTFDRVAIARKMRIDDEKTKASEWEAWDSVDVDEVETETDVELQKPAEPLAPTMFDDNEMKARERETRDSVNVDVDVDVDKGETETDVEFQNRAEPLAPTMIDDDKTKVGEWEAWDSVDVDEVETETDENFQPAAPSIIMPKELTEWGCDAALWDGMPVGAHRDLERYLREGKEDFGRSRIATMKEIMCFLDTESGAMWEKVAWETAVKAYETDAAETLAAAVAKEKAEKKAKAKAAREAAAAKKAE